MSNSTPGYSTVITNAQIVKTIVINAFISSTQICRICFQKENSTCTLPLSGAVLWIFILMCIQIATNLPEYLSFRKDLLLYSISGYLVYCLYRCSHKCISISLSL